MTDTTPQSTNRNDSSKKTILWVVAVLVLVGIIGLLIFLKMYKAEPLAEPGEFVPPVLAPDITTLEEVKNFERGKPIPEPDTEKQSGIFNLTGEHIFGDIDARVSIVEYSDLKNRYSALMHPELEKVVKEYTDVNWIFRHYPLVEEENSYLSAYATECVYNQLGDDGFWPYMRNVVENKLADSEEILLDEARSLVPDEDLFDSCLTEEMTELAVKDDKREGFIYAKIRTTPSFLIVNNETNETRFIEGIVTRDYLDIVLTIALEQ